MIRWRDGDGALHQDTLFGVFAALARGDAWSFAALRPHQREPWHAFTVQVAALALIRAGIDALPGDEAAWRDLLLALTPDQPDGEAWALVVDDWSKPALLQPPVVEATNRADYKSRLPTPDALDMLVTAKNHDVKQERMAAADEEDWLFALVTLQTMEGIMGAGRYGISRMFGGYGNRMSLGIRPNNQGAGAAFRRDVRRLVADAKGRRDRRQGLPLLWISAWNGTQSLSIETLDELYVEICRRVRLQRSGKDLIALEAGSKCPRVAADQLGGNTQDPWMPLTIDTKKDRKTFGKLVGVTPGGAGFGYRQMANLLDRQKVTEPVLARLHEDDDRQRLAIVAAALPRGQGKTEGLHRRTIRTSRIEQIEEYGPALVLDRVGDAARTRSDEAAAAAGKLKFALLVLLQGAPSEPGDSRRLQVRLNDASSDNRMKEWIRHFDQQVDRYFFDDDFWAEAAGDTANHRTLWRERLRTIAVDVLTEAAEAAPRTAMRRVRAVARARSMLDAQMHNWLKEVPDGE